LSVVLVEQTTEPVASEHMALVVTDDDWTGRCLRFLDPAWAAPGRMAGGPTVRPRLRFPSSSCAGPRSPRKQGNGGRQISWASLPGRHSGILEARPEPDLRPRRHLVRDRV